MPKPKLGFWGKGLAEHEPEQPSLSMWPAPRVPRVLGRRGGQHTECEARRGATECGQLHVPVIKAAGQRAATHSGRAHCTFGAAAGRKAAITSRRLKAASYVQRSTRQQDRKRHKHVGDASTGQHSGDMCPTALKSQQGGQTQALPTRGPLSPRNRDEANSHKALGAG
eukprot:357490-Chlamydomonas_euryale.AAC.2